MYEMKICPKCGSKNISKGSLDGILPEFDLKGASSLTLYICKDCGFIEFATADKSKQFVPR